MSTQPEPVPTYCAAHPQTETYLRCGRCGTPICPRCLVHTPVGARCRACARLRRLPVYDVQPRFLLRGAAAGLAAALIGGIVLRFIPSFGLFVNLLLGAAYGYVVAQAVELATNRKRGVSLGWACVLALAIGFLLSRFALVLVLLGGRLGEAGLGQALSAALRLNLGDLLLLAVAALIAYNRLR